MTDHEQLINKIANQFKKQLHRDTDHDEVPNILRGVLMNFENELMGKKRSKRQTNSSDGPKKTNWQAIWTSNSVGCRAYPEFKSQLDSIMKENSDLDRFNVNKRLRIWADTNNKYEDWKNWARAQLEAANKPVPQDKSESCDQTEKTGSTVQKEALQKEPSQKEAAQKEAAQKEAAQKEPSQKEPSQKEPSQKEPSQKEPSQKDSADKPKNKPKLTEQSDDKSAPKDVQLNRPDKSSARTGKGKATKA